MVDAHEAEDAAAGSDPSKEATADDRCLASYVCCDMLSGATGAMCIACIRSSCFQLHVLPCLSMSIKVSACCMSCLCIMQLPAAWLSLHHWAADSFWFIAEVHANRLWMWHWRYGQGLTWPG